MKIEYRKNAFLIVPESPIDNAYLDQFKSFPMITLWETGELVIEQNPKLTKEQRRGEA